MKTLRLLPFVIAVVASACSAGSNELSSSSDPAFAVESESSPRPDATVRADPSPAAAEAPVEPSREIVVAASGDLLVHRAVAASAAGNTGRFRYVLSGLEDAIRDPSGSSAGVPAVTLINLETPLSEAYNDPINVRPPVLGSPPELAEDLASVGVDLVSVANNHALDQMADGLRDTLSTVRTAGLGAVGAGINEDEAYRPWTIERSGLKIAFVGFAQHVNRGPGRRASVLMKIARLREEERVMSTLQAARAQADVVVAAVHWSSDFTPRPADRQRRLAGRMIEAGADVILGTGPHVLQEVERRPSPRGEAVVAYSLGNLVSNQGLHHRPGRPARRGHPVAVTSETRDAVLLRVHLRAPPEGRVEVAAVEAIPMWTRNNFWDRRTDTSVTPDVTLVRLRDAELAERDERRQVIAEDLGPAVTLVP